MVKSVLRFIRNLALSFRIYEVLVLSGAASPDLTLNSNDLNKLSHVILSQTYDRDTAEDAM